MALHRWPTDRPGKAPAHAISWDQHQANLQANRNPAKPGETKISTPGGFIPMSDWDFGWGKGVLTAPTAAPATPAPTPVPAPPDAQLLAQLGGLGRTRDTAVTSLQGQRTRGLGEYGFSETNVDPITGIGTLKFDPNNPFSRASLLKQNYDRSRAQSRQTMGAGGQLYSGAFQNQQDFVNRGQVQAEDALQKALSNFLLGNTGAVAKARADYETGAQTARADAAARALDNPLYAPTVGAEGITPAAPATAGDTQNIGTPAKASSKKKKGKTLKAGPGVKATKNTTVKKTKKGRTVTYTTSVKGP